MFFFKKNPFSEVESFTRRKHKRILYQYPVDMIVGQKQFQRSSLTLSAGGLYVVALFELPPETIVQLRIGTENRGRFINAHGSVAYTNSGKGMGIKFVNISPEDQKRVQGIIDKGWWREV